MAYRSSDPTTARLSRGDNQHEHDAVADAAALRRMLVQPAFTPKPTAYAPFRRQDEHPLHDPHLQLQARLQALRDVRQRLRFVASRNDPRRVPLTDLDVEMPPTRLRRDSDDSMAITTRVALSTQSTTETWVQRGGIVALDGLETLFLGFLTTHELVTAGAVCQSWYALARRDAFWEPLLHTPVERYPLRRFLGFHASANVPAIQVYIIYRKIRAQLQTLHAKDDEAPRQSADALRFEEVMLRFRRAGNNNNNNENNVDDDELAVLARVHRAELPPALAMPVLRRRSTRTTMTATATPSLRRLHLRSVHLVFPSDEDLGGAEEETPTAVGAGVVDEPVVVRDAHPVPVPAQLRERDPFQRLHDLESDEEMMPDGEEDVAMLAPDGITLEQQVQPIPEPTPVSVLNACRRVRLQTWLGKRRMVSRDVLRSLARQLLLALATLEMSQIAHSDVCVGNILVLDRGATTAPLPHATDSSASAVAVESDLPLFQLYCRSAVNIWSTDGLPPLPPVPAREPPQANLPVPRVGHVDALALRLRQRHHRMLAAIGAQGDVDDDDQILLRRLFMPRRGGVDDDGLQLPPPPPPPAPVQPLAPQAPTSATYTNMVRSYLRILKEVWCHGRVATTNERSLPFLSLIYLRHELVKSTSFRSFIEYAEYLMSRNEATPSKLLNHVFVQDDTASSPRLTPRRGSSSATPPPLFVVDRSSLRPTTFANAEDYRLHAISWYSRYLTSRRGPHLARNTTSVATLGSFGAQQSIPSTLFGPAFFHDALSETRLPCQRFLSVAAPSSATSSWVHTLAVSQRFTLQKLDLSRVQLPLSILLRELYPLQRLSHLRLPRAILRDENMEQFVAALWCSGLLPTLQVMDESVKTALDRMEAGYVHQLSIMASYLEHNRKEPPARPHTFSSPF